MRFWNWENEGNDATGKYFQFSLWDSENELLTEEERKDLIFQFSLWDSKLETEFKMTETEIFQFSLWDSVGKFL